MMGENLATFRPFRQGRKSLDGFWLGQGQEQKVAQSPDPRENPYIEQDIDKNQDQ
jgi:hypothetical protein